MRKHRRRTGRALPPTWRLSICSAPYLCDPTDSWPVGRLVWVVSENVRASSHPRKCRTEQTDGNV